MDGDWLQDYAEEEPVRAPDRAERHRLMDRTVGLAAAVPEVVFRDVQDEGSGKKNLARLFAPPTHLLYPGNFQQARVQARETGKWLLVNIQDNEEFNAHRLNRDTWKNEVVGELIQVAFVFWQQLNTTDAGRRFIQLYKTTTLPAILIIDPRTGEKLLLKTDYVNASDMTSILTDFLGKHPLTQLQPVGGGAGGSGGAGAGAGAGVGAAPESGASKPSKPSLKRRLVEDEEDADLQAAIRASLAEGPSSPIILASDSDDSDAINTSDIDNGDSDVEVAAAPASPLPKKRRRRAVSPPSKAPTAPTPASAPASTPAAAASAPPSSSSTPAVAPESSPSSEPAQPASAALSVPTAPPDEPAAGTPGATRIQFRMPNGKRVVRRFLLTDTVATLYKHVAFLLETAHPLVPLADQADPSLDSVPASLQATQPFNINRSHPIQSLWDAACKSLTDADLKNAAVVVRLSE